MTVRPDNRLALFDRLSRGISRRGFVKSGGSIGAGMLFAHAHLLRTAAQENPSLIQTLNAAITLEAFAVTFYGAARGRGNDLALEDDVTRFVRAAQCEEEAHYHFFEAAGAAPARTTFTITEDRIANQDRFLDALLEVETVLVGAHMATARQFAAAGDLRLVEIAYQIGAVEAQHQAIVRVFAGERLGADRAFARWMFGAPSEAVATLTDLGYVDGDGDSFTYPGPVDRYCRGVSGLVAETTEDHIAGEPSVPAVPEASPTGAAG